MEMWSYRYNLKQWKPILYILIDVYMHTEKKPNWIACLMKIKTTNVAYTILALYIYI